MKDKQVMERRTSSRELSLVGCGYEKCSPDHSYGPAVRRYYMFHFILSGKGHLYIHDKHYIIHEGQYFLITPDVLAFYKAEPENPWTYVWICFDGEQVPVMLQHCHISLESPVQQLEQGGTLDEVKEIIFRIMRYPELTPANECYIQSGLYALFARLEESAHARYSDSESNDNFYITQAMAYILSHPFPDITVMDVANYLHISRSYLFALFKKYLHTSPQQFLTLSRITNGRELLAKTDIPIADIASSCGYQNPFAFSRAFKREVGMTPSEYRKEYRHVDTILEI